MNIKFTASRQTQILAMIVVRRLFRAGTANRKKTVLIKQKVDDDRPTIERMVLAVLSVCRPEMSIKMAKFVR